ncbi:MAG: tetratricopeptide repeat protein [Coriobacteriales bacterium]|nr:tetratricopeptide repeat protein [Coriobacteriales bacterium]
MQSANYEQATIAYNSGDYPSALRGFYRCLKEDYENFGAGDAGLLYHRLGNCLLKMHNLNEALATYRKALEDESYTDRSGVLVNLGTTLNGMKRYQEAIEYFSRALADTDYRTPYKAEFGLGNSYMRLGMFVEAGTAYRKAALDEANPNPVKALMNLGAAFTALGRPHDAVEAYLAIIDFRVSGQTLNRAYESLARSYVSVGRYPEANTAFEDALRDGSYQLSEAAQEDYNRTRAYLGLIDDDQRTPDSSGLDVEAVGAWGTEGEEGLGQKLSPENYGAGGVPTAENTGFFTATDADLMRISKTRMRTERKLRHTGLKLFLGFIVVLFVLLGGAVFAYTQGYGFPTQSQVITDFFDTHAQGGDATAYWVANGEEDIHTIERILDGVAPSSNISFDSLERSMGSSTATVSVTLPTGGIVHYRVQLARDLLSWRINGIELVFASTAS